MSGGQLTMKPSCMREIAAFPSECSGLLWEKIDQLVSDLLPDGKVKKKLEGAEGVYRMRVADHHAFATTRWHVPADAAVEVVSLLVRWLGLAVEAV